MTRRRLALTAGVILLVTAAGLVVRNQLKVRRGRYARDLAMQQRHPVVALPPEVARFRQELFDMLKPVALSNCNLERFGEDNDGGYLMCANLLGAVRAAYSYGISGYDKWGCDLSTRLSVPVHQYDCFNTSRPSCSAGRPVFHEECVGPRSETLDGRPFDTVQGQMSRNGDGASHVVMKIDVEGAEWDTLLSMPDEAFGRIDQLAVEFHWEEGGPHGWAHDDRYTRAVARLKQFYEVAHIHFNNASCIGDLAPFPSWAYEVLFVSKRLAVVDRSRTAGGLLALDARNDPARPDCQAAR